jgi:hypothetical protein
VLRPPIAQDKLQLRQGGMVRIVLKKPYADGTVAVDMDPLSLLCRLAASVPPPRHHTIRYAGVLSAACAWRSRIVPAVEPEATGHELPGKTRRRTRYRTWAELLARSFAIDALACPVCRGRMRLVAIVKNPASIARYLAGVGEPPELPARSPDRGPPYWKSTVLPRRALGDQEH